MRMVDKSQLEKVQGMIPGYQWYKAFTCCNFYSSYCCQVIWYPVNVIKLRHAPITSLCLHLVAVTHNLATAVQYGAKSFIIWCQWYETFTYSIYSLSKVSYHSSHSSQQNNFKCTCSCCKTSSCYSCKIRRDKFYNMF